MAGYSGYSKSNNAVAAESDGRYPLTHAVKIVAEAANITQKQARAILAEIGPSEWHHSSKFYNNVNYYDTVQAVAFAKNYDAIKRIQTSDADYRIFQALSPFGTKGTIAERAAAIAPVVAALATELSVTAALVENVYYENWDDIANEQN